MKTTFALALAAAILCGPSGPELSATQRDDGAIEIGVRGVEKPILTQHAFPDMRPYLHPIVAPAGKGTPTENSSGHHKHQRGEWGLKKGETYRARYRLVMVTGETDTDRVEAAWKTFQ